MSANISPIDVSTNLRVLMEYEQLQQTFEVCASQNKLPSLDIRIRMKGCESRIPTTLAQLVHLIRRFPQLGQKALIASCPICSGTRFIEWFSPVEKTSLITCSNCDAVLGIHIGDKK